MADLNFDVRVEVQQALASLQRIENQVGKLNGSMKTVTGSMDRFGSSIKAIGAAVLGANLTSFVDQLQNMQNKLNVAVGSNEELAQALAYVRAIADNTGQSMNDIGSLYAKVAAQADKLGYSQEQVATVTNSFAMALKASGASTQGAASAIYQFTQILMKGKVNGDEFTTIMENMGGPVMDLVASKLGVTTEQLFKMKEEGRLTAKMFSDALIASFSDLNAMAGKMAPTIGQSLNRIKNSFTEFLVNVEKSTGVFAKTAALANYLAKNFDQVVIALAAVAGAWTATKIITWGGLLLQAAGSVITFTKAVRNLGITAAIAEAIATGGLSAIATLTAGLAGAGAAAFAASKLFDKFGATGNDVSVDLNKIGLDAQAAAGNIDASGIVMAGAFRKAREEAVRMGEVLRGFKFDTEQQLKGLELQRKQVGLFESQKAVQNETAELARRYQSEREKLLNREIELRNIITGVTKDSSAEEKRAADAARQQLPEVQKALGQLTAEYQRQIPVIQQAAQAAQDAQAAYERTAALTRYTIEARINQEQEIQKVLDDTAKLTLPEIEQKYYDIAAAARNSATAAINAENERRRLAGQAAMSAEEEAKYREAANQRTQDLITATRRHYEQSRTWSTGWARAMNEYVDNAGNAAKRAENLFRTATQGMEEAIVNFVKTGKFEWRNFVSMMLEELLRAQIQQVFAQLMGNMQNSMRGVTGGATGGGGGLGSLVGNIAGVIGNLFGSNNTSTNPMIIGGGIGGGGIMDTIGNVLGGITGSIGGIVSSIGDFFGGFFANGGTLGAGRWGIAGEAGPELISGPATVTPLGMGGTTNVTYNINAVDAASFKQLVAQDPGFIHAVVMQGAKSMPGTRR